MVPATDATDATGNDLSSIPPRISFRIQSFRTALRSRWQIACFRDAAGRQPVVDYISTLTNLDDLQLIFHVLQRLSRVGLDLIDTKMAKHIDGPIFELRKDRHRIMFARDTQRNRFVLLSTFYKDTQKTPWEEIERAHTNWNDYLNTGSCEVYAVPFDEF
jgi:phage-related protein